MSWSCKSMGGALEMSKGRSTVQRIVNRYINISILKGQKHLECGYLQLFNWHNLKIPSRNKMNDFNTGQEENITRLPQHFLQFEFLCKFQHGIANNRVAFCLFRNNLSLWQNVKYCSTFPCNIPVAEGCISLASKWAHRHCMHLRLLEHCRRAKCQSSSLTLKSIVLVSLFPLSTDLTASELCRIYIHLQHFYVQCEVHDVLFYK